MANSSTSPTAILTNLLEADATLATQEAEITIQLEALREKRQSLKTVIDLFSTTTAPATSTQAAAALSASKPPATAAPKPTATPEATAASTTAPEPAAAPEPTATRGRQATKATKKPRQSRNWQDYLQDPFRQTSLPVAITTVFQQQPKQLLSVPDLINAIFTAEIPQDVRNKARDRMLNILSTGAKDGQWFRGKKGQYSLTKAAAEGSR
ncbi:hypothetical protein H6F90_16310 [Trichocoleus sp. FACHB-591]|uniref:hypothetical protein n=1 Tax=Trichocoleus sp. FACHB-591 TaxID=2692872 RepID=UPI0016859D11|nr:hypothetical protein [Trichocoleus sp. FACHB-591]MBD2096697.1 hypothetical protein [Trichocoleus sp. FACHB-591]